MPHRKINLLWETLKIEKAKKWKWMCECFCCDSGWRHVIWINVPQRCAWHPPSPSQSLSQSLSLFPPPPPPPPHTHTHLPLSSAPTPSEQCYGGVLLSVLGQYFPSLTPTPTFPLEWLIIPRLSAELRPSLCVLCVHVHFNGEERVGVENPEGGEKVR